jgi:hypothetical protein
VNTVDTMDTGSAAGTVWVVTLTFAGLVADEDTLIGWGDLLDAHDASLAHIPGTGLQITVWTNADDPLQAPAAAAKTASKVVQQRPTGIEVLSPTEHERRANEPTLPELVATPEVGDILGGLTRQRVYQLQNTAGFPEPLYRLRTGPVWDRRAIEHYGHTHQRRPGRPRRQPA